MRIVVGNHVIAFILSIHINAVNMLYHMPCARKGLHGNTRQTFKFLSVVFRSNLTFDEQAEKYSQVTNHL